jgi:hypothetical protein
MQIELTPSASDDLDAGSFKNETLDRNPQQHDQKSGYNLEHIFRAERLFNCHKIHPNYPAFFSNRP